MGDATELGAVVDAVAAAFDRLNIPYFVTGSFASSIHGELRATNDLDLVAEIDRRSVETLVALLSSDFLADAEQAAAAVEAGEGFSVIHRTTFMKADVYPCTGAFKNETLQRAEPVHAPGSRQPVRVATREDILLAKLRWYRLSDDTSERQQRDIEGLIALNRGEFDEPYLRRWATSLGIGDLLLRFMGHAPDN